MFDHVEIPVSDVTRSKAFYRNVLAVLGYDDLVDNGDWCGFGRDGKVPFAIFRAESVSAAHLAFVADDRATVDRFHAAALKSGGRDNGAPGLRTEYAPNYYAAFVHDPDGNNVEAVCKR